jgi:hypothetical protein
MKCRDVGNCRNMLYPFPTIYQLCPIMVDIPYYTYGQMRLRVRESGLVVGLTHPSLVVNMENSQVGNAYRPPWLLALFLILDDVSPDLGFPIYQADNELDLPLSTGEASSFLLSNSSTLWAWVGVGKVYIAFYLFFSLSLPKGHTRSKQVLDDTSST